MSKRFQGSHSSVKYTDAIYSPTKEKNVKNGEIGTTPRISNKEVEKTDVEPNA